MNTELSNLTSHIRSTEHSLPQLKEVMTTNNYLGGRQSVVTQATVPSWGSSVRLWLLHTRQRGGNSCSKPMKAAVAEA